jgi:hypothetical protein
VAGLLRKRKNWTSLQFQCRIHEPMASWPICHAALKLSTLVAEYWTREEVDPKCTNLTTINQQSTTCKRRRDLSTQRLAGLRKERQIESQELPVSPEICTQFETSLLSPHLLLIPQLLSPSLLTLSKTALSLLI